MSRDMIDAASAHAAAPSALLPGDRLAAETHMDAVTLYVRDIDAMVAFYTNVIALEVLANDAADGRDTVVTENEIVGTRSDRMNERGNGIYVWNSPGTLLD